MPMLAPIGAALAGAGASLAAGAAVAAPFIAAGSLGFGLSSLLAKTAAKIPAALGAPGMPKPQDADKKAKEEAARRRKISGLTGGLTNLTGPLGALAGAQDVQKKTLLGA